MDVKIGSRWQTMITQAIESGRYASMEDVINEGLRLVAEREAKVAELRASLVAAMDDGGEFTSEEVLASVRQHLANRAARKLAAE